MLCGMFQILVLFLVSILSLFLLDCLILIFYGLLWLTLWHSLSVLPAAPPGGHRPLTWGSPGRAHIGTIWVVFHFHCWVLCFLTDSVSISCFLQLTTMAVFLQHWGVFSPYSCFEVFLGGIVSHLEWHFLLLNHKCFKCFFLTMQLLLGKNNRV